MIWQEHVSFKLVHEPVARHHCDASGALNL